MGWEGTPGGSWIPFEEDRNKSTDLGQGDENPDLSRSVQELDSLPREGIHAAVREEAY